MDKASIITALKEVYDPELPVDIYELGLVYDIQIEQATGLIHLTITLTTPSCPAAELIPQEIKQAVARVKGVKKVEVTITFDPPYTPDRMSEEARLALGW